METKPTNWENKTTVQKGDIGEDIVRRYLESYGYVVYKAITDGPHHFDFLASKDKQFLYVVEVKTKARLNKYPATGLNVNHYNQYKTLIDKGLEVFVFFVDELDENVYGGNLKTLEAKTTVDGIDYPKVICNGEIIIFPLDNMKEIGKLTKEEVAQLKGLSTRNPVYDTPPHRF